MAMTPVPPLSDYALQALVFVLTGRSTVGWKAFPPYDRVEGV
jgi:hypothetical protein